MTKRGPRHAFQDESGATTIEFVVVFLAFISMMMFVIELTLYQFSMASLEKAAQAGVRYAVVSAPAARNVELENDPRGSARAGAACSPGSGSACDRLTRRECRGSNMGTCRAAQLDAIVRYMRQYNGAIQRRNVTVIYDDTGIGFAGGPSTPMVTVSISGVQVNTGILGMLLGNSANGLRTLPRRAASMTGEDLG